MLTRYNRPRKNAGKPSHAEKLFYLLKDGKWHPTRELVEQVAHCFAVAKYQLVHRDKRHVETRRKALSTEYEYRLTEK